MNLETKITIYKFTPQLFTLTRLNFEPLFPSLIEGERKEIMIIFLYLPQISE